MFLAKKEKKQKKKKEKGIGATRLPSRTPILDPLIIHVSAECIDQPNYHHAASYVAFSFAVLAARRGICEARARRDGQASITSVIIQHVQSRIVHSAGGDQQHPLHVYRRSLLYCRARGTSFPAHSVLRSRRLCPALNYDPALAREAAEGVMAINVRRSKVGTRGQSCCWPVYLRRSRERRKEREGRPKKSGRLGTFTYSALDACGFTGQSRPRRRGGEREGANGEIDGERRR